MRLRGGEERDMVPPVSQSGREHYQRKPDNEIWVKFISRDLGHFIELEVFIQFLYADFVQLISMQSSRRVVAAKVKSLQ